MSQSSLKRPTFVLMLMLCLLLTSTLVSAQATPIPINIGQNVQGQLSAQASTAEYSLSVTEPQVVELDVLSFTNGFVPSLQVFDPSGALLFNRSGGVSQTLVQSALSLTIPGTYRILISGTNAAGQFALAVQPGVALALPEPIEPGDQASGILDSDRPFAAYTFAGLTDDVLLLSIGTDTNVAGTAPVARLLNAETGETLGLTSANLLGARFRIPAGEADYRLEMTSSGIVAQNFNICLETEDGTQSCPDATGGAQTVPTATATATAIPIVTATPIVVVPPVIIPPGGPCSVVSASGGTVNIRSGASTAFPVLTQLPGRLIIPVLGRIPDNTWFQVNINGTIGWISATVVTIGGNCGSLAIVVPPTLAPTITPTFTPTLAPTTAPTATPSLTPSLAPTNTPTLVPAPAATLNYTFPAVFGSTALVSGFVPDPFTVGVTSGGPANVSYLGGGCTGFATTAPSFSVTYTSGSFSLLRFYFVGGGDTTMIINTPSANYVCVDDSFGTFNPTIDFNSPSSGRYDVWIGSYNEGAAIGGTLYVTESSANSP